MAPKITEFAEQQRINALAIRHTLWLLRLVYTTASDAVESFEHDDLVGPDLAYLMGAIIENNYCSWPEDRPIVQILRNSFPERDHPIWNHVEIEHEEEEIESEAFAS